MKSSRYELVDEDKDKTETSTSSMSGRYSLADENQPEEKEENPIDNLLFGLTPFSTLNKMRPIKRLRSDIGEQAGNMLKSVAEGVPASIRQGMEDPWRLIRNVAAGGGSIPFNMANMLVNIPAYVESLLTKNRESTIKKYTPQIPVEKGQQWWVGGETSPEDEAIRQASQLIPILPGVKNLGMNVAKPVKKLLLGENNPIAEAEKINKEQEITNTQKDILYAQREEQSQSEKLQQAKSEAKKNVKLSDPDLMVNRLTENEKQLSDLQEEQEKLNKELEGLQTPKEPISPTNEKESQAQEASAVLQKYEDTLSKINKHHQSINQIVNKIENDIGQALNIKGSHAVDISKELSKEGKNIENYWKDEYKNYVNKIKDVNFHIPESAMSNLTYESMTPTELVKIYGADAFDAIKKGKMEEFVKQKEIGENPYYKKLVKLAPTKGDTNAAAFLLKRKAFREGYYDLKRAIKDSKFSVLEEEEARQALGKAKTINQQIEQTLEAALGEHLPEFQRINHGYENEVFPLRANPVMRQAHNGALSDNVLKQIRTNYEGMPLIRQVVNENPEIRRNIIGQRYKIKPEEVYHPDAEMKQYLEADPELQKAIDHRNNAANIAEGFKAQSNLTKRKIAEAKIKSKEATKAHEAETIAFNKELAKFNKETNSHIKTKADLENKLAENEKKISRLENKQQKLKKYMQEVKEEFDKQNINLKRKNELGLKLKELKQEYSDIDKELVKTKGWLKRGYYTAKAIVRIGKSITGSPL